MEIYLPSAGIKGTHCPHSAGDSHGAGDWTKDFVHTKKHYTSWAMSPILYDTFTRGPTHAVVELGLQSKMQIALSWTR